MGSFPRPLIQGKTRFLAHRPKNGEALFRPRRRKTETLFSDKNAYIGETGEDELVWFLPAYREGPKSSKTEELQLR